MIFASGWWGGRFVRAVAQCGRQAFRCEHRKRGALGDVLQDDGIKKDRACRGAATPGCFGAAPGLGSPANSILIPPNSS